MTATTKRGPGRPPDLAKRRDVLDATRAILADVGYSSLTIDGVARQAGTARSYVYRVWESKMALVTEALFEPLEGLEVPDTGSMVDDLRDWVALHVAVMDRSAHVKGLPGLTIELMSDAAAYRETYRRYVKPTEDGFTLILDRARARGEAVADVDGATMSRVMSGTAMQLAHVPGNDSETIVETVMATLVGGLSGI